MAHETSRKMTQAKIDHFIARGRAALKTSPDRRTDLQKADIENFLTLGEPAESEVKKAKKRFGRKMKTRRPSKNPFKDLK